MKVVAIVVAVIVLLVGCCGGIAWFGYYAATSMSGDVVLPQVEHKAAIVQYIGTVDDITLSFEGTGSAQQDDSGRLAFDISGDKGSGLLLVQQSGSGLVPAKWAILEIDGNSYVVLGAPPEDLGAETVEEPETDDAADAAQPETDDADAAQPEQDDTPSEG